MASTSTSNKLECSICYKLFRTPKILPCFHTFCQPCLEQLAAGIPIGLSQVQTFKCPTCRRDIRVPNIGVAGFQENFYITDELEARRSRDNEKCVLHNDRQVTEVCTECDVLICDDCKAGQHRGHPTILFKNEIAAARKELNDLLKGLEGHSSAVKTALINMPDGERATEKKIGKLRKDIEEISRAWRNKIDIARVESLRKLDAFASARKAKLQNAVLQAQKDQQAMAVLVEQTRYALNEGRAVSVLAARIKVKSEFFDQNRTKDVITNLAQPLDQESLQMNRLVHDVNGKLDNFSADGFWKGEMRSGDSDSGSDEVPTSDESQDDDVPSCSASPLSSILPLTNTPSIASSQASTTTNDSSNDSAMSLLAQWFASRGFHPQLGSGSGVNPDHVTAK